MNTSDHPDRVRYLAIGWGLVAVLVVAVSWGRGIAMDLMVAGMSVVEFFGGGDVLHFRFDWLGAGLRGGCVVVMVLLARRVLRYQRISRGACGSCGRNGSPGHDRRSLAKRVAWLSLLPALGYGTLKVYWAFGGTAGLVDPDLFGELRWWSPGFLDTAILSVIGAAIALAMAYRRPRLPRWLLLTPALIGCAMLLPVAVIGMVGNVVGTNDVGPLAGLAPWVTWFVYGCMAAWGPCLAVVTVEYHYGTRGECRVCGRV